MSTHQLCSGKVGREQVCDRSILARIWELELALEMHAEAYPMALVFESRLEIRMTITIKFEVSYSQLAVFASALSQPYNDWSDRHVAQGFAWRPGSVSFRTLSETGSHVVEIDLVDHTGGMHPDRVRAIEVPFDVPDDGAIEIGSIAETVPLALPAGSFLLRCAFRRSTGVGEERVRLTFAKKDAPRFAVIRADSELSPDELLLTTAEPAC
jgi:hypothetical protein